MSESAEVESQTELDREVIDGLTVARTETGERYTVRVKVNGGLELTPKESEKVEHTTPTGLDAKLRHGEFYVPEYSPASEVYDALRRLSEESA